MNKGKDIILLLQPERSTSGAMTIAHLTENSFSIDNEIVDEQTKDGRLLGYGQSGESFEMAAYGKRGDAGQKALFNALKRKERLKVWEVNTIRNERYKYDATFARCIVESSEKTNPTDSFQEITATLQVDGQTHEGELKSSPGQSYFLSAGMITS